MAERPMFVPAPEHPYLVREVQVHFKWIPGMALSQAQKCIASLHESCLQNPAVHRVLDISSKSPSHDGVDLSAFNLTFSVNGARTTVESAFQSSKVFEHGGPFVDLLAAHPMAAKKDPRIRESGSLLGFRFLQEDWPLVPRSAFYDWLYLSALRENPELAEGLLGYDAFTDIAFNPAKSINCQARAAALYVSLRKNDRLEVAMSEPSRFLEAISAYGPQKISPRPTKRSLSSGGLFQ